MTDLWRPSGLQPCRKCGKVAIPPSYVVFGTDSVYHRSCLIPCGSCDFAGPDEAAMRDHKRGFHKAEESGPGPANKNRLRPQHELRSVQNSYFGKLQAIEPWRIIDVQHRREDEEPQDPWHPWTSCEERGCGNVPATRRGILRGEIIFDVDGGTYVRSYQIARRIAVVLQEMDAPAYGYSSGGKHSGIHLITYVQLPENCNDRMASKIRTAVLEHVIGAAGLSPKDIDEGPVTWTPRHMATAIGTVRKGVYTYMPVLQSTMPLKLDLPPRPSQWNPMSIPEVQEAINPTREPAVGPNVILGAHRVDVRDDRFAFVQHLLHPAPTFHDVALFRLTTMLRAFGLSEDETAGFVGTKWKPENECHTPGHNVGMALTENVRRIHRTEYSFNRAKTAALLRKMGREPDRVLWKSVFYETPLRTAPGQDRYNGDCGRIEFVACPACGRNVPIPNRCRDPSLCPDCAQRKELTSALRYKGRLEDATLFVHTVPFDYVVTTRDEAGMLEKAIRKTITKHIEIVVKPTPMKAIYVSMKPFTVNGIPATKTDYNSWKWMVVSQESVAQQFIDAGLALDEAADAAREWTVSMYRRKMFVPFGWVKGQRQLIADQGASTNDKGMTCPYCGFTPLPITSRRGDWTAGDDVHDRTERRRYRTGYGPPR